MENDTVRRIGARRHPRGDVRSECGNVRRRTRLPDGRSAGALATHRRVAPLKCRAGCKQMRVGGCNGCIELLERCDVDDPDRAAMRGGKELPVAWMDLEIVDGHGGQ